VWYTASNPLNVSITVIDEHPVGDSPAGMPDGIPHTSNSSFTVRSSYRRTSQAASGEPIKLIETGSSQDTCQNKAFSFTYHRFAQYTETYIDGHGARVVADPSKLPASPSRTRRR